VSRRLPLALAAAGALLAAAPGAAGAAEVGVAALDDGNQFRFAPNDVTAELGDTVKWGFAQAAVPHNVNLVRPGVSPDDTAAHQLLGISAPNDAATFTAVVDQPGVYQYYCSFHGGLAPGGMSGRIVVGDVPPPPPVDTGPAPQPNTSVFTGPFEEGDFTPPSLTKVGVLAKGRTVKVRYVASEAVTVDVALRRGRKVVKRASFPGRKAGIGTVTLKKAPAGRLTAAVTATDAGQLTSKPVTRKLRVR
jgi:plastocyanin